MGDAAAFFRSSLPIAMALLCLISAWRFGDWRNWRTYYPTILFAVSVDFFISLLLYKHQLWQFHKTSTIPNHTLADFMIAFTNLPCIVLVYLTHYPLKSRMWKQLVYIAAWSIAFTGVEAVFFFAHLMTYHNNWSFAWSIVVWVFMFLGLRLHFAKPLWAWLLCLVCTAFLIVFFHIPVLEMK
ncbi:CBO0543 family protein [Paenibacillus sp. GCM10023248]|uniref:CBO0543 family protein n=1 Tax=Bacillales TaxID=1385 RepID=UPI0023780877|nr:MULTISPECIES: CBO0543 family protein [Bacillales]MDD9266926.1 hypothetical protein [Paenibacillus sp. MAHUQ-63]MDR6881124.1 hypothetical protein [Bacillus sp. 3255]